MKPLFRIMQGKTDVTARAGGRNSTLTITDGSGENADTIQYTIDDKDGIVEPPETGVEVQVFGGYEGNMRDFGRFKIDSVNMDGWPQQIEVTGQSIDAKGPIKEKRKKSYKTATHPTYNDLFKEVAGRNSLTLSAGTDVGNKALKYEAQSEEDDLEFLTRVGNKLGALVSVKNGHLVVTKRGVGKSASGQRLPVIYVVRGANVLSYRVSIKDKPKHSNVEATYFDRETAETKKVQKPSFDEGPTFLIREPFADEEEATEAAAAKAADLKRAIGTAEFEITGSPFAMAEADVEVYGIRSLVDGTWRATNVTHTWSGSAAYSTSVSCEAPDAGPTSKQPALPALSTVPVPTPRPQ